jgi:hypothetical protein
MSVKLLLCCGDYSPPINRVKPKSNAELEHAAMIFSLYMLKREEQPPIKLAEPHIRMYVRA